MAISSSCPEVDAVRVMCPGGRLSESPREVVNVRVCNGSMGIVTGNEIVGVSAGKSPGEGACDDGVVKGRIN